MKPTLKQTFKLKNPAFLLFLYAILASAISYVGAYDPWVWFFEVIIGFVGISILLLTYHKFRFSNLVYILVAIHFAILATGAHYTYAEMPLFDWLRDAFDLSRNHFDRVGHFAQGFVPAIIAREIFLRKTNLKKGKMLAFIVIFTILGLSAFYEFIEWWSVILIYSSEGVAWLGTQGDIWDAHQDMFMAFSGAILALLFLSRLHDRSMAKVLKTKPKEQS